MSPEYCECSRSPFILTKCQHAQRHREWQRGFKVSKNVAPEVVAGTQAVLLVNGTESPKPLRRVAFRLARVAQRQAGWDFPTFPHPDTPAYFAEKAASILAAIKLDGRYAVGYVVSVEEGTLTVVTEVYVCAAYRRRGIATELVHAIARVREKPVTQIAYGGPFTRAGWALAKALSASSEGLIKVVGPGYLVDNEEAA
jgi:ribosomal protein S18 acetylase RimI-like enzyme